MNKQRNLLKTFRTIFLAILLCFILSYSASAATNVCSIGSKGYTSLAKAVKAAKSGSTIKVTKAITTTSTITINKNITINFNNKKYTYKGKSFAFIINKKASFKNGNIIINADYGAFAGIDPKGSLSIQSGKYSEKGEHGLLIKNYGTLTVNKGTLTSELSNVIYNVGGKVTIKNGTFTNKPSNYLSAIANSGGTLIIKNGTFKSTNAPALLNTNKGKCTIYNGTFLATNFASVNNVLKSVLTIKNGVFGKKGVTNYSGVRNDNGTIHMKGGKVYLAETRGDEKPVFNMSGGTITGCDDANGSNGWALHIMNNSVFNMRGGTIQGNSMFLVCANQENSVFNMTGGVISNKRKSKFTWGSQVIKGGIGVHTWNGKIKLTKGVIYAKVPYYVDPDSTTAKAIVSDSIVFKDAK